MSEQIDAIYDNGVLRPLVPLSLPDKAHVRLTLYAEPVSELAVTIPVHKAAEPGTGVPGGGAADDFDAQLDELLFDGPSLPADFSRADIYADHD